MNEPGRSGWIGSVLVTGCFAYIAIALWQAALNTAVIPEAAAIAVILAGLCSALAIKNPGTVKKGEIAVIWICICLFAIYGILRVGGIL